MIILIVFVLFLNFNYVEPEILKYKDINRNELKIFRTI